MKKACEGCPGKDVKPDFESQASFGIARRLATDNIYEARLEVPLIQQAESVFMGDYGERRNFDELAALCGRECAVRFISGLCALPEPEYREDLRTF